MAIDAKTRSQLATFFHQKRATDPIFTQSSALRTQDFLVAAATLPIDQRRLRLSLPAEFGGRSRTSRPPFIATRFPIGDKNVYPITTELESNGKLQQAQHQQGCCFSWKLATCP